MSDYTVYAQANPGTDYPVKDALLRAQLTLDSDKVDSAAIGYSFGYKRNTTAALNVGYYGGVIISGGALTIIADGTVALTDATTNYVERTKAGVVSKNTVGFTAGSIPMFTAVTAAGAVTTVTDKRQRNVFGDLVAVGTLEVTGTSTLGAMNVSGVIASTSAQGFRSQTAGNQWLMGAEAATGKWKLTENSVADMITVAAGGAVSLYSLLDLSAAGCGQIKFPASPNASADANTLDDYEEGSWTPSYAPVTGSFTSITYQNRTGKYVKIGRKVFATVRISTDAVDIGASSGQALITGLPFAVADSDRTGGASVYTPNWASIATIHCVVLNTESQIRLYSDVVGNAWAVTQLAAAGNSNQLGHSLSYLT